MLVLLTLCVFSTRASDATSTDKTQEQTAQDQATLSGDTLEVKGVVEADQEYYILDCVWNGEDEGLYKIFRDTQTTSCAERIATEIFSYSRLIGLPGIQLPTNVTVDANQLYITFEKGHMGVFEAIHDHRTRVPESLVKVITVDVITALRSIHGANMIHRNLGPHSLVVSEEGKVLVRVDGTAFVGAERGAVVDGRIINEFSPFRAPEEYKEEDYRGVTRKVDIWSLGVLLYTLVTGQFPNPSEDTAEPDWSVVESECGETGVSFLRFLLQVNPEDRPEAYEIFSHPWLQEDHLEDDIDEARLWLLTAEKNVPAEKHPISKTEYEQLINVPKETIDAVKDHLARLTLLPVTEMPADNLITAPLQCKGVTHFLGKGTYGTVVKAEVADSKKVAVKVIKKDQWSKTDSKYVPHSKGSIAAIVAEALIMKRCFMDDDAENVSKLINFAQNSNNVYMSCPLAAYGSLKDACRAVVDLKQTFSEKVVSFIAKDLATALRFLHSRNIIHRDVKEDNVLIDEDGRMILADFGLSAIAPLDLYGGFMYDKRKRYGTPNFFAPEQHDDAVPAVNRKVDIFALGVLLFRVATGKTPFKDAPTAQKIRHVLKYVKDGDLHALLAGLMAVEPERRTEARFILDDPFIKRYDEDQVKAAREEMVQFLQSTVQPPQPYEKTHQDIIDRKVEANHSAVFQVMFDELLGEAMENGANWVDPRDI